MGWKNFASGALLVALIGCGGRGSEREVVPVTAETWGSGDAGLVDGDASRARFHNPVNVEIAPDGTTYVADYDNDAVRAISPRGTVTTVIAGLTGFSRPFGLAVTKGGTLYVQTDANDSGERNADTGTIWRVDVAGKTASVVARNLGRPRGLHAIADGRLVLSDIAHHTISLLDLNTKEVTLLAGAKDQTGLVNGRGGAARFNRPYGVDQLGDGTLLVADAANNVIRAVTLTGDVTTYAGTGTAGRGNGLASQSQFKNPQDVAVEDATVYVADTGNHLVRRISKEFVYDQAGNGVAGYREGEGNQAQFFGLEGIDALDNVLMIADGTGGDDSDPPYNRVRRQPI